MLFLSGWWWLEHGFYIFYDFPYIGNVMTPTDFHSIIFQRGRRTNHQPVYSTDSSLQGKGKGKGKQLKMDDALKVGSDEAMLAPDGWREHKDDQLIYVFYKWYLVYDPVLIIYDHLCVRYKYHIWYHL